MVTDVVASIVGCISETISFKKHGGHGRRFKAAFFTFQTNADRYLENYDFIA